MNTRTAGFLFLVAGFGFLAVGGFTLASNLASSTDTTFILLGIGLMIIGAVLVWQNRKV